MQAENILTSKDMHLDLMLFVRLLRHIKMPEEDIPLYAYDFALQLQRERLRAGDNEIPSQAMIGAAQLVSDVFLEIGREEAKNPLMDFGASMEKLQAMAGTSEQELHKINQAILDIGEASHDA